MKDDRRTRDLGVLLPLACMLLLLPPYIVMFDQPVFLAGVPLLPAYIFSAWMFGIVCSALLSRRILRTRGDDKEEDT